MLINNLIKAYYLQEGLEPAMGMPSVEYGSPFNLEIKFEKLEMQNFSQLIAVNQKKKCHRKMGLSKYMLEFFFDIKLFFLLKQNSLFFVCRIRININSH